VSTKLDFSLFVFLGRPYVEYISMFDLSEKELMGKQILDCPADTCSFTAMWQKKGLDITACDSAY
jgi:hypothetical protein